MASQTAAEAAIGAERRVTNAVTCSAFFFWMSVMMLGLVVAVVVHDLVTMRKVHRATLIGVGAIAIGTVAQQFIAGSDFGQAFVRSLG